MIEFDINPEDFLDEKTKEELRGIVERRLHKEYDFVLLIVGRVGDGKSMLAALACAYTGKISGRKFNTDKVFFTAMDYRMQEDKLKRLDSLDFDEGEECFFSRRAMTTEQQKMILKFAQIRQQNFFITICAPSLFLLEKWLRGVGKETRVDCIWKIERRGTFSSYSAKTKSLQKIKIDTVTNDVKYPNPVDFYGHWKPIPKDSKFWKDGYLKKKNAFLKMTKESEKFIKHKRKMEKLMADSFTLREITELCNVKSLNTVRLWLKKYNIFPKKYVFVDPTGKIRIRTKGYEIGMKNLEKKRKKNLSPRIFHH